MLSNRHEQETEHRKDVREIIHELLDGAYKQENSKDDLKRKEECDKLERLLAELNALNLPDSVSSEISPERIANEAKQILSNLYVGEKGYLRIGNVSVVGTQIFVTLHIASKPNYAPEDIIAAIRSYYQTNNTIDNGLTPSMSIEEGYVRLALVKEKEQRKKEEAALQSGSKVSEVRDERNMSFEDIYGTKTPIALTDLFKVQAQGHDKPDANSVIILGRAGIGKSTVCQHIAYQWSKPNGLFKDKFELIIGVPLRNLLNEQRYFRPDIRVADVVYEECLLENAHGEKPFEKKYFAQSFRTMLDTMKVQNKKVLYVLDGYDKVIEALNDAGKQPNKIITLLLKQDHVILTSRPHYITGNPLTNPSNQSPNQVETIGFLNEDIDNYIDVFFQQTKRIAGKKADAEIRQNHVKTLKQFLIQNVSAKGMAHVPINLALMCHAWASRNHALKNTEIHELTLTALYSALIHNLSLRYLKKNNLLPGKSSKRWSALSKRLPMWNFLKTLAFQQMQNKSLLIMPEEVAAARISATAEDAIVYQALDFGLLKSTGDSKLDVKQRPCYFIHLTFQEFLAAHYIVDQLILKSEQGKQTKQGEDKNIETFIKQHKYQSRYEIVWWFVAGLLHEQKKAESLDTFFQLLDDPNTKDLVGLGHVCLIVRCMDEARQSVSQDKQSRFLSYLMQWIGWGLMAEYPYQGVLDTLLRYIFISPHFFNHENVIKTLTDIMDTGDKNNKCEIVNALELQPALPAAVLDRLVDALHDDDSNVRQAAADALRQQPTLPVAVWGRLVDALRDADSDVRQAAIDVLEKQSFASVMSLYLSQRNPVLITILVQRSLATKVPIYFFDNKLYLGESEGLELSSVKRRNINKAFSDCLMELGLSSIETQLRSITPAVAEQELSTAQPSSDKTIAAHLSQPFLAVFSQTIKSKLTGELSMSMTYPTVEALVEAFNTEDDVKKPALKTLLFNVQTYFANNFAESYPPRELIRQIVAIGKAKDDEELYKRTLSVLSKPVSQFEALTNIPALNGLAQVIYNYDGLQQIQADEMNRLLALVENKIPCLSGCHPMSNLRSILSSNFPYTPL